MLCNSKKASRKLRLKRDGTFKIAQITDLHYLADRAVTLANMQITGIIVDAESPDLVVFTGDQISGWFNQTAGSYADQFASVVKPLIDRNTSWASVLGNHDREADLTPTQIMCNDYKFPLSYTLDSQIVAPNGLDYILPVYQYDSDNVALYLLMLDSGHTSCEGYEDGGCVTAAQVDWLKQTYTMEYQNSTTGLVFVHQPVIEFNDIYYKSVVFGNRLETTSCPAINNGLYAYLASLGHIYSMSIGHDHRNDFHGRLAPNAPFLSYGRKTGFGSYGNLERGSKIIFYNGTAGISTYIRTAIGVEEDRLLQPHYPNPSSYLACGIDDSAFLFIGLLTFSLISVVLLVICLIYRARVGKFCRRGRSWRLINSAIV